MSGWQQDVLQTMGLTILQPRFDFPAALPGFLHWQDASVVTDEQPAIVVPALADTKPALIPSADRTPLVDKKPLVDAGMALRDMPVADETPLISSAKTTDTSAPLRFRQRLLRFDHLLMLVDQPALQWAEEQEALVFFNDIYFALYGKPVQQFQQRVFTWPPGKNFPQANDKQHARQTFSGFIQEMLADASHASVISWGKGADYLLDTPLSPGDYVPQGELRFLQLHPLNHYWQQPASKHLLWQHLQAVRQVAQQGVQQVAAP